MTVAATIKTIAESFRNPDLADPENIRATFNSLQYHQKDALVLKNFNARDLQISLDWNLKEIFGPTFTDAMSAGKSQVVAIFLDSGLCHHWLTRRNWECHRLDPQTEARMVRACSSCFLELKDVICRSIEAADAFCKCGVSKCISIDHLLFGDFFRGEKSYYLERIDYVKEHRESFDIERLLNYHLGWIKPTYLILARDFEHQIEKKKRLREYIDIITKSSHFPLSETASEICRHLGLSEKDATNYANESIAMLRTRL